MLSANNNLDQDHNSRNDVIAKKIPPANSNEFLHNFDSSFHHRVLLTDPSDFASLITDANHKCTLSFQEFCDCLESNDNNFNRGLDSNMVLKKAVRNHISQQFNNQQITMEEKLAPLRDLILETYQQIRKLIPNRIDLHSLLDDGEAKDVKTWKDLPSLIKKAAMALTQLESESRATTTRELIREHLSNDSQGNNDDQTPLFWLTAIMYLLYKTELCHSDKQSFYLVHVWAPRIHREGPAFVKDLYEQKFGAFSDAEASPATRQWIQSLLLVQYTAANPQAEDNDEKHCNSYLQESPEERKNLIRTAWIDAIVFRNTPTEEQQPFHIPEIFTEDLLALQAIREVTRLSVAGCALFLHACNAAKVNLHEAIASNIIAKRKKALVKAMMRNSSGSQEQYENNVAKAVVGLAGELEPRLRYKDPSEVGGALESLVSRTVAVLRGKDPVLQLLDNRIKLAVRDIVLERMHHKMNEGVPLEIRTGIAAGRPLHSPSKGDQQGQTTGLESKDTVEELFCLRGLGFFAPELAQVATNAGKIVDLAIELYWDDLLDKLILDHCT